jgi:hypothetical protein
MGISWAKPSLPFDVTRYRHFPANPDFASLLAAPLPVGENEPCLVK